MSAKLWALAQLLRRLWMRAALYGFAGVAAALLAALFSPFVPRALAEPFGGGTVTSLLNVLASSLLTVATFSATAVLTAYTSVASNVTPRASALITADSRTQTALASFIGGFLYSIVAFSALGTGYYAHGGRAILFLTTVIMMVWIAITLLTWLDHLSSLARMGKVIEKVEDATRSAIAGPFGAGVPKSDWKEPPGDACRVGADRVGYVRNVDLEALRKLADKDGLEIWVLATPGVLLNEARPLAVLSGPRQAVSYLQKRVRSAFDISGSRTFDQDPRFGFVVLAEIASRALSPAVNDPGTAIDVIGTMLRLLTLWREQVAHAAAGGRDLVYMSPLAYSDLLDDIVRPIATDGASNLSVSLRLQKALAALYEEADQMPAIQSDLKLSAKDAAERAKVALSFDQDIRRVSEIYEVSFSTRLH